MEVLEQPIITSVHILLAFVALTLVPFETGRKVGLDYLL